MPSNCVETACLANQISRSRFKFLPTRFRLCQPYSYTASWCSAFWAKRWQAFWKCAVALLTAPRRTVFKTLQWIMCVRVCILVMSSNSCLSPLCFAVWLRHLATQEDSLRLIGWIQLSSTQKNWGHLVPPHVILGSQNTTPYCTCPSCSAARVMVWTSSETTSKSTCQGSPAVRPCWCRMEVTTRNQ